MEKIKKMNLQFFSDGAQANENEDEATNTNEKTFTQEELNKIVQREKAKAKEQALKELNTLKNQNNSDKGEKEPTNSTEAQNATTNNDNKFLEEFEALKNEINNLKESQKIEQLVKTGVSYEQAQTLSKLEGVIPKEDLEFISKAYGNKNTASTAKANNKATNNELDSLGDLLKDFY